MSKDKISDYSATANSNTDIGGINIDEGCAPSGINDAIRTLMKQLKDWQSGSQDVYIHPAGSASVPSITATGDTNTGLFFPAADTVGITTGGTERARIDSSGNLGLGVTPSAWGSGYKAIDVGLAGSVYGDTAYTTLILSANSYNNGTNYIYKQSAGATRYTQFNGAHSWYNAASGTAGNAITFTQAMTLDASGNLAVGTTTGDPYSLGSGGKTIAMDCTTAGTGTLISMSSGGSARGYFYANNSEFRISAYTAIPLIFKTSDTERARIDSSGNFIVGKASTSNALIGAYLNSSGQWYCSGANGSLFYHVYDTTNSVYRFYISGGGQIYATNTSIVALSDVSLKENIRDLETGLSQVMGLKPRRFDWKNGDATNVAGFIAQELEEVLPELVYESMYTEGETKKSIKMGDILPTLVKAIQEQQAIIETLTNRITALEQA